MFRKLLAMETEALKQGAEAGESCAETPDRELLGMARELSRCVPGPSRFGPCASRPVF